MTPGPWTGIVLALGVYRVVRLIGWDEFPPVARARDWVTGARVWSTGSANDTAGLTQEKPRKITVHKRAVLEHFLTCPFCVGFWLSIAAYVWWLEDARSCLYALSPLALAGAVGLISKNLDP